MATLQVEKRTRISTLNDWSEWTVTTEAPPYVSTDLVEYRIYGITDIDIDRFTNGSIIETTDSSERYEWSGTGIFDVIMKAVNGNIRTEYDNGRITGSDYATVYLGALQTAITSALQFLLQEQEVEAKVEVTKEQKNLLEKQQALVERQTKGFDDDAKQKLLKQALDSWSVAYSVAQDENSIPDSIKVNPIDSIMKNALDSLGISVVNDPIGES